MNLLYSEVPADIYQVVADKTIAKLKGIIAAEQKRNSAEIAQDDEVSDAQLAQHWRKPVGLWWLDFGITRKWPSVTACGRCCKTVSDQNAAGVKNGSKERKLTPAQNDSKRQSAHPPK